MKLLNKTLRPFLLYSLLVLALSIPVYFLIVNGIWINELDKHHYVIRKKIAKEMNALKLDDSTLVKTLAIWNKIQPGILLTETNGLPEKDSFYTVMRYDIHHADREQFRCFTGLITINNKKYRLLLETNMEEVDETLLIIVIVTLLFFILLLTGSLILNRRLTLQIWKPFYDTIHQLKAFDLNGQKKVSFIQSDIQEFEELNEALSRLIEKNIAVFLQQKELTENASHELQTPLALIKSKVDLLLQDPSLSKDQSEKIASLNIPLSKVSRINKNLLLLARLENKQFAGDTVVRISEIISENLELLEENFVVRNIILKKCIEEHFEIKANQSLFEILITNLIMNAIRHTHSNGEIGIVLKDRILTINNTGRSSLNTETLFKRFINTSSEAPSSGLGLAIVKEICNRHNWQIHYKFENHFHNFSIFF